MLGKNDSSLNRSAAEVNFKSIETVLALYEVISDCIFTFVENL